MIFWLRLKLTFSLVLSVSRLSLCVRVQEMKTYHFMYSHEYLRITMNNMLEVLVNYVENMHEEMEDFQ